jgi:hypothetical protein
MPGSSNGKRFAECSVPLYKSRTIPTEAIGNGPKSLKVIEISVVQTVFDDLNVSPHQNTGDTRPAFPLKHEFAKRGIGHIRYALCRGRFCKANAGNSLPRRKNIKCWLASSET